MIYRESIPNKRRTTPSLTLWDYECPMPDYEHEKRVKKLRSTSFMLPLAIISPNYQVEEALESGGLWIMYTL